jgi:hypothetical protein
MSIDFIGTTYLFTSQWSSDENALFDNIKNQINIAYPDSRNLLIGTTWFGPQFSNSNDNYSKLKNYNDIDNLFFVASVDEVMLNNDQLVDIGQQVNAKKIYYLGNFDTEYQFTFHSTLLPKYFRPYAEEDLLLKDVKWIYLNYNRKPREHRSDFVKKIIDNNLKKYGIVTLGINNPVFSKKQEAISLLLGEKPNDFAKEGNWGLGEEFGIPHDIHSLGNMDYWQNHFLNIVGETEFFPWNHMFISEKTWKPILGLRPFVLNGQTRIYQYLRDNGFKTFNHYFDGIELEDVKEFEVHDSIISVIKYLAKLDQKEIMAMYNDMLPALRHNKERFFEFAQEQTFKIDNLFL